MNRAQDHTATTLEARAEALLDGGDRSDPSLPTEERELRQIRNALRRAGLTEVELAGRLGQGNLTVSASLTGQRRTNRQERLQMALALVAMLADAEAVRTARAGPPLTATERELLASAIADHSLIAIQQRLSAAAGQQAHLLDRALDRADADELADIAARLKRIERSRLH